MKFYFAFGSNMSSRRLEARVGPVWVAGRSVATGYEHRFDKLGRDGTSKGNIARSDPSTVHGVLYRLTPRQLDVLEGFEGGYRRASLAVVTPTGDETMAETFMALRPGCTAPPSADYVRHYARGLAEHGIDSKYSFGLVAGFGAEIVDAFEREWRRVLRR